MEKTQNEENTFVITKAKPSAFKKRSIKFLTRTIELAIPFSLTYLLLDYAEIRESKYRGNIFIGEFTLFFLSLNLYAILILEWIRRYKVEKDKNIGIKYIYIIVMILAFILSIKYLSLLYEPKFIYKN